MACSVCSNDILSLNIHIVFSFLFFYNSRNAISKLHQSQFHRSKPLKYVNFQQRLKKKKKKIEIKKKEKTKKLKIFNTYTGAGLKGHIRFFLADRSFLWVQYCIMGHQTETTEIGMKGMT